MASLLNSLYCGHFNKHNNHIKGTVGMMTASLNIGLFAYPLVDTIWPKME